MAEFHEIGSSQFTDVIPTGEEKIQISASQRTTLQNIANLAPEKGVKQVVVTNFQTNTWKLSDGGNVSFPTDIKVGEIVTFKSAQDAVKGPGVGLFGYAIKHNSLMASYVGMTTSNKVNGIPTIYTYKSAGAYATAWQQLPDASVKPVEITAFTEGALSSLLYTFKAGDFIPFYTGNVTASTDNQFPESGIFNGFISMGSNEEGDYFQIFAFKSGSTKAYLGACIGSTTQWTALEGGGAQTVKKLPGLDVRLNESTDVIPYTSIKLTQLQPGVTLMLCFEIADAEGRFSPSGNVVVYYDLPPANDSWKTIAGFLDNATGSNGSINVRRRVVGVLDFQCTSELLECYPGLQVYLKHIFVLG